MWKSIKAFAGKVWNGIVSFVKKHLHKAVAVTAAGLFMVTVEVLGFLAADALLLPLAMISVVGLIGLCFAYFLVMFGAVLGGMEIFEYLWNNLQFKASVQVDEEIIPETHADAEFAAEMAGVNA